MSNIELPLGNLGTAKLPETEWQQKSRIKAEAIRVVEKQVMLGDTKRNDYILWWHDVLMNIKGTWSGPLKS